MDKSINRVFLKGKVGSTKIIKTADSSAIRFSLATQNITKDRNDNPFVETWWHNVVAWQGKGIQDLEQIKKESTAYVEGRLRYVRYTSSDGTERVLTEILADLITIENED